MIYALKQNGTLNFSCASKTKDELDTKIETAFWMWKGMQAKGSNKTITDFLEGRTKVSLTIKPID